MPSAEAVAANIIRTNRYLSLATMGDEGPWIAPLAYTLEPDASLLFYSAKMSRHGRHIGEHTRVAATIFDSSQPSVDAEGVQLAGEARLITEAELGECVPRYFRQSFPDPRERARWERAVEAFLGAAPLRFYRIRMTAVFKNTTTDQQVDCRMALKLDEVHQHLSHLS